MQKPVLALTLLTPLAYLAAEFYVFSGRLALPLDDSWIHLQFAKQLAAAHGLAFNDGEWVTGSTAPLWTAVLAIGFLASPALVLIWAKIVGMACLFGSVIATDRLGRALGLSTNFALLAAALVASCHWLVWSALSGMEIMLFTCLTLWGLVLHLRQNPGALPLLAAATLARPEGILLLVIVLVERCVRRHRQVASVDPTDTETGLRLRWLRPPWSEIAAAALVLMPTLLFYRWVGGSFLPATFEAKTRADGWWPNADYLRIVLDILLRAQPVLTLFAAGGMVLLLARLGSAKDRGLAPAAWLLGQALYYSMLASDQAPMPVGNFGRYYFPLLPIVVLLGLLAVQALLSRSPSRLRLGAVSLPLAPMWLGLLLVPQLWILAHGPGRYLQNLANVEDTDVKAALWLREHMPPGSVVAAQDVGAVKYLTSHRIVDLVGLTNPEIVSLLRTEGPTYWEQRLSDYMQQQEVDVVVVFTRSYPMLASGQTGYRKLHSFRIEDNVTMAGSELLILATPWAGQGTVD